MREGKRWLWIILLLAGMLAGCGMQEAALQTDSVSLGLLLTEAEDGLYVLAVIADSPAARAGMLPGDCILTAGGIAVSTADDLNRLLGEGPGELCLMLRRDEATLELLLPCR